MAAAERKGRQTLETAIANSGGREVWESIESIELELADDWQGFTGWLFRPWPGNPTHLRAEYQLGMKATAVEFLSEPRLGERWGVDASGTWTQAAAGQQIYAAAESSRFILQAYQYFFELPFELSRADIVLYAGERERDGRDFDLVFVTWNQATPHSEHDQYLLWIARDSGRLEIAQYTIREKFDFAQGVNHFSDFRRIEGLWIPHAYRISTDIDDPGYVHRVELSQVQFRRR